MTGSSRARRALVNVLGLGVFAVSVFPVCWMVATAFKPNVFAYTFLRDQDNATLPIMLQFFFGRSGDDWGPIMAASTLLTLPVIGFSLLVHRRLVTGLTAGAVKA